MIEMWNSFFAEEDVFLHRFWDVLIILFVIFIIYIFIRDITQKKHTIKHNFPVVGNIRYFLESIGPELRQYLVAHNREELPFSRSDRSWVYASSKQQNNYQGFGTDKDVYQPGHEYIYPSMFPFKITTEHINHKDNAPYFLPSAKIIGKSHNRKRPYRPFSIINISAMSFGSLSANAVSSLNRGAIKAGCYHNTGEGSLSPYHAHGADVVFHIGTGYFGCRAEDGGFSMEKLVSVVEKNPFVRMIEIKLSQGAKPGKGGVLPAKKITAEISAIRGVPMNKDVISPAYHVAFEGVRGMCEFLEEIAKATGLPVGIKSAVGKLDLWRELAQIMKDDKIGPDFISIDGGEGGTGAAPPAFADYVARPLAYAFPQVYKIFQKAELTDDITFIVAGKAGFPARALTYFAMGADLINVAREAMLSIGCIQAQVCHNNTCPTGIATQNKWLASGIDPKLKGERLYNYMKTFRKEVLEITHACGYEHPCQMTMKDVAINADNSTKILEKTYDYVKTPVPFNNMLELYSCQYLGGGDAIKEQIKLPA
jgi:glutamate synthase domain-containing protein 2